MESQTPIARPRRDAPMTATPRSVSRRRGASRTLTAIVALALIAGMAACAPNDDDPIAVGFIGELTGPFAIWGIPARNGMQMAVDDLNASGGVAGRPLVLIERDTQGLAEEAVTALRGLIDRHDVVAAGGLVSSDVALAAARIAEDRRVPLFLVKAGSDQILSLSSRMTFRTCLPAAPMNLDPIVEFIEQQGITRVGAVVADYAWGRAIQDAMISRFAALDVRLEIEVAPVAEREFTPYLRRLADMDPQLIVATGHPPGALPLTRQAAELGIDAFITGSNSPAAAVMATVGEAAFDRYVDFTCADYDDPAYVELAARYYERFGDFMEDDAVSGYGQVLMVAQAIEAIGGTDPAQIAEYLHETTFDLPGYAWDLRFTAWGELADARPPLVVLRRQTPPDGVYPSANWYPQVLFEPEPLEPHVP